MIYDYCIIGAGPAGLYAGFVIRQRNPGASIVILEKEDHAGGRSVMTKFEGIDVVTGAGIGRKEKDVLLRGLLHKVGLHRETREFSVGPHNYASALRGDQSDFGHWIGALKTANAATSASAPMRFRDFAAGVLGTGQYREFVKAMGYSDFESADHRDVMKYYGFEDNYKAWTALHISWNELMRRLIDKIGLRNVKFRKTVISIGACDETDMPSAVVRVVKCADGSLYSARKVVVAGTVDTLTYLFPRHQIYRTIKGQSFMRAYVRVGGSDSVKIHSAHATMKAVVPRTTIVGPPLQKIIPIDPDRGIYMIYADNRSAEVLNRANSKDLEKIIEQALSLPAGAITILRVQWHYWDIGTHYNKPLPRQYKSRRHFLREAQRPMPGVFVVGEVVALQQGWTEGALESVESIRAELL